MGSSEGDRRVAVVVHAVLLACLGVYGAMLAYFRSRLHLPLTTTSPTGGLFVGLALVGALQFAVASAYGRRILRSSDGTPGQRARTCFLIRAAAAEAIGLFGLLLGLRGAPAGQAIALFAITVAAMLFCAPTRPPWEEAVRLAESRRP